MYQAKISTKTNKDGCSPAVFRSRLEQKYAVTEWFIRCICVLFQWQNPSLQWEAVFVSVATTYHSFAPSVENVPLMPWSVL